VTPTVLWILVFVALASLVVVQVASARAARKLGGASANAVVALRALNAVLVLGLVAWLLWRRFGGA